MAVSIIKTRQPFDTLVHWNEYIDYINESFGDHEEKTNWSPQVQVKEQDGIYNLKMNIPGFRLKDIKIDYSNGFLTIIGNKKAQSNITEQKNPFDKDLYNNFKSVVRFPNGIQQSQIKKVLKKGILEIQVPAPSLPEEKYNNS
jgi:HSP20 family protein